MYEVFLTNTARKSIKKLSSVAKKKVYILLKDLGSDPKGFKLKGVFSDYYSLHFRVKKTQYRIIYGIDRKKEEITIYLISTRENFYKKAKHLLT